MTVTEEAQACEARLAPALPALWAVGVALFGGDSRAVRSHQAPPAPLTVGCPPRAHNTGSGGPGPRDLGRSGEVRRPWPPTEPLPSREVLFCCVFWGKQERTVQGLPPSPVVWWLRLRLPVRGVQVRSLVGKLRSHMPPGQKPRTYNRSDVVTNSIKSLEMVHILEKNL